MAKKELLKKLKHDRRLYAKKCLKIRDKDAKIVPLVYNFGQEKLIKVIEEWDKKPSPKESLYIIILKARQIGFSTATEAVFFQDLCFNRNMTAMIVSYDEDSAQNINNMAQRYYQYLPQAIKPARRPARGKGLFFENPKFDPQKPISPENHPGLQSHFLIETARNINAGSSFTIHRLHISELAKWPNPQDTMTSLMQAVPSKNAIVVVESTALGLNYFYELWTAAEEGRNNFVPIFVAWWEHPEYERPYTGFELTEYEQFLIDTIPEMTLNKLQWRRDTIADKLNGDEELFKQEYPSFPEEAFLSTGTPVYDVQKVMQYKKFLEEEYKKNPPLAGRLECDYDDKGDPIKGTERFVPDKNGWLTIYQKPKKGVPYVIGGDTAEGGADYSAGQVIDNLTGEQVAEWHHRTDTDLFAKDMFKLGHYYNYALIGIEINFDLHPVKELQRLGYHNQYRREVYDEISNKKQHKYGWRTTQSTRGPIIDTTVTLVREEIHKIKSIKLLEEMLFFVRNPEKNGKPEAEQGKHDDLIMAFAIAHAIRSQHKQYREIPIEEVSIEGLPPDLVKDLEEDPQALAHWLEQRERELGKKSNKKSFRERVAEIINGRQN